MKTTATYLLRLLLGAAIFAALIVGVLATRRFPVWDGDYLIAMLSQLVIFHHLFYAALGAVVVLTLLSYWRGFVSGEKWRLQLLAFVLLAAAFGALPTAAVLLARPGAAPWQALVGSAYSAVSVLLFLGGSALMARNAKWTARIRRAVVLADILSPPLVWAAYREGENSRLRGVRLLPFLLMTAAWFLPWIAWPLSGQEFNFRPPAALRPIFSGLAYQVEVDPTNGDLIATDNDRRLLKIDPATGAVAAQAALDPIHDTNQGFGINHQTREVIYVDPCTGHTWVFDETDLHLKRDIGIQDYLRHQPFHCRGPYRSGNRVVWSAAGDILAAFTFGPHTISVLNAAGDRVVLDGRDILAQAGEGNTADAVIDPARGWLHRISAFTMPALWRIDIEQRRVGPVVRLPTLPERIALDAARNRLFITLPILGQVWVFDAAAYRHVATIFTFPGVRVVTLDPEQNLLFLGGFSPLLEIRSLDDFSLQDRIVGPAWMRWIAVDPRRDRAYITSNRGSASIWALDLAQLRQDQAGAFWRRIDPFYPLMRLVARCIRPLILLLKPDPSAFVTLPPPWPQALA